MIIQINFDCVDAVTTKRSSRSGRGLLGFFFIHTEMDAIFQPIKKSETYQIRLYKYNSWYIRTVSPLLFCTFRPTLCFVTINRFVYSDTASNLVLVVFL